VSLAEQLVCVQAAVFLPALRSSWSAEVLLRRGQDSPNFGIPTLMLQTHQPWVSGEFGKALDEHLQRQGHQTTKWGTEVDVSWVSISLKREPTISTSTDKYGT